MQTSQPWTPYTVCVGQTIAYQLDSHQREVSWHNSFIIVNQPENANTAAWYLLTPTHLCQRVVGKHITVSAVQLEACPSRV